MAQTRIVLSPEVKPMAEELRQVTGASSVSEVVTLLFTRYGPHLKTWWQTNPHGAEVVATPSAVPLPVAVTAVDELTPMGELL